MKIILIFFCAIIFSIKSFSRDLFESDEFILEFSSNNINIVKNERIDQTKIHTFDNIMLNILTNEDYLKMKKKINKPFVDSFILNHLINEENIINNNYYSKIKINFNKKLIIKYLINNKINFVENNPEKFLLIVYEQSELNTNLLSKKNSFYKYLLNKTNENLSDKFILPNLDINDRYLLNEKKFINFDRITINKINQKYKTNYQIHLHSKKINNYFYVKIYFIYENKKLLIFEKKYDNIDYSDILVNAYYKAIDRWKYINRINTSIVQTINCNIYINNLYELKFLREQLDLNISIKNFQLKAIKLNENLYEIIFFGDFELFKKSLINNRLNLVFKNDKCNINLI